MRALALLLGLGLAAQASAQSQRSSADDARWRVTVPANGRASVTATFDTRH